MNIRIGLHTGPVSSTTSDRAAAIGYTGAHVNRAARIEPVRNLGGVRQRGVLRLWPSSARRSSGARQSAVEPAGCLRVRGDMQLAKGIPPPSHLSRFAEASFCHRGVAKAAHDLYCVEARRRGEVPARMPRCDHGQSCPRICAMPTAPSGRIPNKLRLLGYELAPEHVFLRRKYKFPMPSSKSWRSASMRAGREIGSERLDLRAEAR